MKLEQVEKDYRAKVKDDYQKLKEYFEEGKFDEMAGVLGDNTILVSPEGERLQRIACLKNFWEKERANGATTVSFESTNIFVHEVSRVIRKSKPEETIIHAAHEITEFKLITEKEGEILKNCDGSWGRTELHPQSCVWEP